jgi:transcriptional regulator with XRE-family HTH domain
VSLRAQSTITGAQLGAARKRLGWTYRELAQRCGVSLGSITRLTMCPEWPLRARPETVSAIERVLEEAGVVFAPEAEGGVKLRHRGDTR